MLFYVKRNPGVAFMANTEQRLTKYYIYFMLKKRCGVQAYANNSHKNHKRQVANINNLKHINLKHPLSL